MRKFILLLICLCASQLLFAQKNGNQYFFVFLNTNPSKEALPDSAVKKLQDMHMENISKLYSQGRLVAAGPFEGGGGMFILQESSAESARAALLTDAAIAAGRFKIDLLPLKLEKGNICKVGDDAAMTQYQFIRLKPNHDNALLLMSELKGAIVASGSFGKDAGGFIILNEPARANAEQFVKRNSKKFMGHEAELKTLHIGKGTFCE